MMYRFFMLLAGLLILSCQSSEKSMPVPQYTIEQFYANTRFGGGVFSPDEAKLLINSDESGIFNVYEIDIASGEKKEITHSKEESCFAVDYVPGTLDMLYFADKGGNEIDHLYLLSGNGDTTDLTPGATEKANFLRWSADDKAFYYASNVRDPKYFDIYKMYIGTWKPEMFYQNNDGLDVENISDDEQWITLTHPLTTSENELFLVNRISGERREISSAAQPASFQSSGFSKDSKQIYYITNAGKEFAYLMRLDINSGECKLVYETNWDVMYSFLSEHETYRVIGINEDGKNTLVLQKASTGENVPFPDIPDGDILSLTISRSENMMRLTVGTSIAPPDIYVYNIASQQLKKLTKSLNPEINPADLVSAEVVRFKSFDGLEIPAIYYKPHQASAHEKVPAMVWVHGGPGGQSRVGYFSLIQYLVNHGYAVLAVNNRGSSGYGKTFYKMDDRNHGDKDLKDCVAGKNWLANQPYIDGEHIGIIGGSYGGYMTMAALTFAPEEFDLGVNLFGVTNWLRTLMSIPPYWESFRKALYEEIGDPYTEDSVRLYNISPLFHADKVTKPLMVLQGANDPRVIQAESDDIVNAVRKNNVPVEYLVFPDEGHGFVKKENEIRAYGDILKFLDTYLKDPVKG